MWSPHGHPEAVDALLAVWPRSCCSTPSTSPTPREALRPRERRWPRSAYVVDLAWLRSTPWRERVAATFDPPRLRPDLRAISAASRSATTPTRRPPALLLVGWLASRLGWEPEPLALRGGAPAGTAHGRRPGRRDPPRADARAAGPAAWPASSSRRAGGRWLRLDRGPGGLRARYKHARGTEREWTILGASRGEAGILGEGIRQALLRDPTYGPALEAARSCSR